jgi:hypothetical protein
MLLSIAQCRDWQVERLGKFRLRHALTVTAAIGHQSVVRYGPA